MKSFLSAEQKKKTETHSTKRFCFAFLKQDPQLFIVNKLEWETLVLHKQTLQLRRNWMTTLMKSMTKETMTQMATKWTRPLDLCNRRPTTAV
jgi:hypothetical protein